MKNLKMFVIKIKTIKVDDRVLMKNLSIKNQWFKTLADKVKNLRSQNL